MEASYEEVWELHKFVTGVLGQPSVIVDADDLCENPGM